MAKPTQILVDKLREAAASIESSSEYNWGNICKCNCGHLAHCVTSLSFNEIYQKANAQILEEWTEYANDYCEDSGAPMNAIIDALLDIGIELSDISHLEYLSDPKVLKALPGGYRELRKGQRPDVAIYMRTWASLLDSELKALQMLKLASKESREQRLKTRNITNYSKVIS